MITWDTTGDGYVDTTGFDVTQDGYADLYCYDYNQDGLAEMVGFDYDQNGVIDQLAVDSDQNGSFEIAWHDDNQDGVHDRYSYDLDGDSIFESAPVDTNGDGVADSWGYAPGLSVPTDNTGMSDGEAITYSLAEAAAGPSNTYTGTAGLLVTLAGITQQATWGTPDSDGDGWNDNVDYRPYDSYQH